MNDAVELWQDWQYRIIDQMVKCAKDAMKRSQTDDNIKLAGDETVTACLCHSVLSQWSSSGSTRAHCCCCFL